MNFDALARPEVLAMSAYVSARNSAGADGVLLNANEAPDSLLGDPAWEALSINRYPPPQPDELRDRLAGLYGVDVGQLLITRGSDEGIDLLMRVFCRAGQDAIMECPPCFGMYRVSAQIQGAEVLSVMREADSLTIDTDGLERQIRNADNCKLVFLTSPNNPTGETLSEATVKQMLDACGENKILILDEAYIEFCDAQSAARWISDYPQLVVLRTLSKAWASAGLRCGSLIAHPALIGLLQRVMAPYPLSAPAIAAALAVTDQSVRERQQAMLEQIKINKARLLQQLAQFDWIESCWAGEANFVLIRVPDGPDLVRWCAERGVRIRDFSRSPLLTNCVRLTVGNQADMLALSAALECYGADS